MQTQFDYFAGSSSVPAYVEMMGFLGMGNNPMAGATVAVAVAVQNCLNRYAMLSNGLAVGLGGFPGLALRYLLSLFSVKETTVFPGKTFAVTILLDASPSG